MNRPIIKLEKDAMDVVLELLSIVAAVVLIGLPITYYSSLPDVIPVHFDGKGIVDGYGSKKTIFILPVVGIIMFVGLYFLNRAPHIFNYPVEITEENAEKQYRIGTKLIRWMNLIIVVSLSFVEWRVIASATERVAGLGSYFMPIFLGSIFGTIIIYLVKSRN